MPQLYCPQCNSSVVERELLKRPAHRVLTNFELSGTSYCPVCDSRAGVQQVRCVALYCLFGCFQRGVRRRLAIAKMGYVRRIGAFAGSSHFHRCQSSPPLCSTLIIVQVLKLGRHPNSALQRIPAATAELAG